MGLLKTGLLTNDQFIDHWVSKGWLKINQTSLKVCERAAFWQGADIP